MVEHLGSTQYAGLIAGDIHGPFGFTIQLRVSGSSVKVLTLGGPPLSS